MYNHLKHTLQIVEELHWVTIENAHAQARRAHWPQGVASEVVGVMGVDTVEVVKLVVSICLSRNTPMRMMTSWL